MRLQSLLLVQCLRCDVSGRRRPLWVVAALVVVCICAHRIVVDQNRVLYDSTKLVTSLPRHVMRYDVINSTDTAQCVPVERRFVLRDSSSATCGTRTILSVKIVTYCDTTVFFRVKVSVGRTA